jgi:hypothetical protein
MLFDIDSIVKKYTDQVKPHLKNAGDIHTMFMSGVIDRLDRVVDNTNASGVGTYRRYFDVLNIPVGNIATMLNVVDLVDNGEVRVPPHEDWKLEYAYARAITGANTFYLIVNGTDIGAFPGSATSLPSTLAFPLIQGGSLIQIMMGTGGGTLGKARLQFEVRRPLSRNQAWSGQSNPVPDRMDDRQEAALELRHAGTFTQGHNIRGEDRVPPDPSDRDM